MLTSLFVVLTVAAPKSYDVTLQNCYDADTCTFSFRLGMDVVLQNQQVRFCGINAPELEGVTKAQAQASRDALLSWMRAAKILRVDVPQKATCLTPGACDVREKYGRWLGYVFADGVNLNDRLVAEGLAATYALKCE